MSRNEIRIVDIPDDLFASIKKRAKESQRTINRQALMMIKGFDAIGIEIMSVKEIIKNYDTPLTKKERSKIQKAFNNKYEAKRNVPRPHVKGQRAK